MSDAHPLDALAPTFWTRPEAINAWRLAFEDSVNRIPLLTRVLRHLPADRGTLEFLDEFPGDRFILLLTYDLTSNQSWQNQAWILSVLAETGAITAIAAEGSSDVIDVAAFRNTPSLASSVRKAAIFMLRESKMGPSAFVGMTASVPIDVFGIDDKRLYAIASKHILAKNATYWDAIRRRAPRMLDNTLAGMAARKLSILAVCQTDYNYDEFRRILREQKIAHAGIRPRVGGPSVSFEDFWKKVTARSPLDDLLDPRPGLFRSAFLRIRRWLGL